MLTRDISLAAAPLGGLGRVGSSSTWASSCVERRHRLHRLAGQSAGRARLGECSARSTGARVIGHGGGMADPHRPRALRRGAGHPSSTRVLDELRAGRKRSHWMWFVFPQLRGLGRTPTAEYYGIASRDEAVAYLAHDVLGPRLRQCARLVTRSGAVSAEALMGSGRRAQAVVVDDAVRRGGRGRPGLRRRAREVLRRRAGREDPGTAGPAVRR